MTPEPDYEKYSIEELIDVYEHIDRENFPDRFKKVALLLNKYNEDYGDFSTKHETEASPEESIEIKDSPEITEMKKMKRIDEFFNSLSDSGSTYHSDSFSNNVCSGGDIGDD